MSLVEIAREIELLAGIHTAREQAKLGSGIPAEDARNWLMHGLQGNSNPAIDFGF